MKHFQVSGYFSESEAKKIVEKLDGATFMNLNVGYSNCAGNCTILVCTDYDGTLDEIKDMFYYVALSKLAE